MNLLYQDRLIIKSLYRKSCTLEEVYAYAAKRCGIDLYDVEQRLKAMDGSYVDCNGDKYSLTVEGKSILLLERHDINTKWKERFIGAAFTLSVWGIKELIVWLCSK